MVGQADRHVWGASRAALLEPRMWRYEIIEAHQQPDASAMMGAIPGQPARTAPPWRHLAPAVCHTSSLDGLAQVPRVPLRKQPARLADNHAGTNLHDVPCLVPPFHGLGVAQVLGSDSARCGLRPTCSRRQRRYPTPTTGSSAAG